VIGQRLVAQRLARAEPADPAEIVRALVGVQAQDRAAAFLALRARGARSAEEVERALSGDGSIVRTWAMRGTLHLVGAEDVPLVLAVFGPLHLARGRRRLAELGLPPGEAERSTEVAADVLAEHGPLTRHELAEHLRRRGVAVGAHGQAPVHVVRRAALCGVLREVGVRGREELYGPAAPGPRPDRDAAIAELARRYARAHAPATAADFAAWSGLPAADVRRGWSDDRTDVAGAEGGVTLLPAFDEWLLGWASRDPVLAPAHARAVAPGGGIIRPVAIEHGRVFATWRLDRPRGRIHVAPFGRLGRAEKRGVDAEAEAIGAFYGSAFSPQYDA
jgi:Winged helix DNA-binding domain